MSVKKSKIKLNKKIAQHLVKADAWRLGPFISSFGLEIPFDYDFRRIISSPRALKDLGDEMGKIAKKYHVNLIAGAETAGIPLAAAVSLATNIPMVYARKDAKKHGMRKQIEGMWKKGDRAALIDDSVASARQKELFVKVLKKHGVSVPVIITIAGSSQRSYPWMKQRGIDLYYLCDRLALLKYFYQQGKIPRSLFDVVKDAYGDFRVWITNKDNLKKIEIEKKKKVNQHLLGSGY